MIADDRDVAAEPDGPDADERAIGHDAPAWTPQPGWTVGRDANGRRESPILTCLRNLGPSPASEIANELGRSSQNVGTQLRQMEIAGRVRRTGRTVSGRRGGPQIEFELMPEGGTPTDTSSPVEAGVGPVDQRLQKMAERIGKLAVELEHAEQEAEAARAHADELDTALIDARAIVGVDDEAGHEAFVARLEHLVARPAMPAGDDAMRRRYFDLLLSMAEREGTDEHIFDRLERLIDGTHEQE